MMHRTRGPKHVFCAIHVAYKQTKTVNSIRTQNVILVMLESYQNKFSYPQKSGSDGYCFEGILTPDPSETWWEMNQV